MIIGQIRKYCNEKFSLSKREQEIRDKRQRRQISTATIVRSVYEMPWLGQKSLLELDQYGRSEEARRWHDSQRKLVVSDTTVERVLRGVRRTDIIDCGYQIIDRMDEEELLDTKLPSKRKVRLGVIDGTVCGRWQGSVLGIYRGGSIAIVDCESSPGRGHERAVSRNLIKRSFRKLGDGFFSIIAADGLYPTHKDFQLHLDHKSHLLVKTSDESLTAIADAKVYFDSRDPGQYEGIMHAQGVDAERGIAYDIQWAEEFIWDGITLSVARVRERYLKPRKGRSEETVFWVLTTATGFSGEDLRVMAHWRWNVENAGFKRLNLLTGSKRKWMNNKHASEMLIRLLCIGLTLLGAFLTQRGEQVLSWGTTQMKQTWLWLQRQIQASLWQLKSWPLVPT